MGHNLSFKNGKAEMMSVLKTPWHGLGAVLTQPPKTTKDAIKAAGLNWRVGLLPIYCGDGNHYHQFNDLRAVVRLDRWGEEGYEPFGRVRSTYEVLQNEDAFRFFDPLIKTGQVAIETAGALAHGARVWMLAKVVGADIPVADDDVVQRYLLLSTGHDGRTAVQIRFTPVRVVCQNTLTLALRKSSTDFVKAYHVPGLDRALLDAQQSMAKLLLAFAETEATFRRMVQKKLNETLLDEYVTKVFPYPQRKKRASDASYKKQCDRVDLSRCSAKRGFHEGIGNAGKQVTGSLWAAYNGVTELVDHRSQYRDPYHRLQSCLLGEAARTKQLAFDVASEMAKS